MAGAKIERKVYEECRESFYIVTETNLRGKNFIG